jgi:hypothetical protein
MQNPKNPTNPKDPKDPKDPKSIALESFRLIETGDAELAERIIAAGYLNQEADDDPDDVERQLPGPAGIPGDQPMAA